MRLRAAMRATQHTECEPNGNMKNAGPWPTGHAHANSNSCEAIPRAKNPFAIDHCCDKRARNSVRVQEKNGLRICRRHVVKTCREIRRPWSRRVRRQINTICIETVFCRGVTSVTTTSGVSQKMVYDKYMQMPSSSSCQCISVHNNSKLVSGT